MDTASLGHHADTLRSLHHAAALLLLPNAWDAASAAAVHAAGFPVVATSSGAISASLGHPDTDSMPVDEAFAAIARVTRAVPVPVTADIEAGYGLEPSELVGRLLGAGAVGCNLEDTDHRAGGLAGVDVRAAYIAAVKQAGRDAGVDVVVNARVDVFLRTAEPHASVFDDAVTRGRAYLAAGADCIYPITLEDEALIARYVEAAGAPVNIMVRPSAPPPSRLQELGVARASLAGGLYRTAMAVVRERLAELAAG